MGAINELRKNDVHIKQVENIQQRIAAHAKACKDKTHSYAETISGVSEINRTVSTTFNNREMSLVATKLQEAEHWCGEENRTQAVLRLTEAKNWAGEYIKVLQ